MKKIILFFATAILLAACNGNGNKQTESINLVLDSISDSASIKVGKCNINAQAKVVYPKDVEPIKKDLMELVKLIGQGDDFDGYSDTLKIDTADMGSLVNYLVKSKTEWLKADFVEGMDQETPMSYLLDINVLEETEQYITMGVYEELLFSGPHPNYTSYGITYLKSDGKKIIIDDLEVSKTDEIKKELQTIVRDYFKELTNDDEVDVDQILVSGENDEVDFPVNGLYIQNDSVVFAYQIDELASYAFGMPDVKMSLKQMKEKGWLGKILSDMVK